MDVERIETIREMVGTIANCLSLIAKGSIIAKTRTIKLIPHHQDPPFTQYASSPALLDDANNGSPPLALIESDGEQGEENDYFDPAEEGGDFVSPYAGDFHADRAAHGLPPLDIVVPFLYRSPSIVDADAVNASPEREETLETRSKVIEI